MQEKSTAERLAKEKWVYIYIFFMQGNRERKRY
jgi:hypothetical protein